MTLWEAYNEAIEEDDDPQEREELSVNPEIKTLIVEELVEAMKETRAISKTPNASKAEVIKPMFSCVAFWFIIGVRTGKILRDQELAGK